MRRLLLISLALALTAQAAQRGGKNERAKSIDREVKLKVRLGDSQLVCYTFHALSYLAIYDVPKSNDGKKRGKKYDEQLSVEYKKLWDDVQSVVLSKVLPRVKLEGIKDLSNMLWMKSVPPAICQYLERRFSLTPKEISLAMMLLTQRLGVESQEVVMNKSSSNVPSKLDLLETELQALRNYSLDAFPPQLSVLYRNIIKRMSATCFFNWHYILSQMTYMLFRLQHPYPSTDAPSSAPDLPTGLSAVLASSRLFIMLNCLNSMIDTAPHCYDGPMETSQSSTFIIRSLTSEQYLVPQQAFQPFEDESWQEADIGPLYFGAQLSVSECERVWRAFVERKRQYAQQPDRDFRGLDYDPVALAMTLNEALKDPSIQFAGHELDRCFLRLHLQDRLWGRRLPALKVDLCAHASGGLDIRSQVIRHFVQLVNVFAYASERFSVDLTLLLGAHVDLFLILGSVLAVENVEPLAETLRDLYQKYILGAPHPKAAPVSGTPIHLTYLHPGGFHPLSLRIIRESQGDPTVHAQGATQADNELFYGAIQCALVQKKLYALQSMQTIIKDVIVTLAMQRAQGSPLLAYLSMQQTIDHFMNDVGREIGGKTFLSVVCRLHDGHKHFDAMGKLFDVLEPAISVLDRAFGDEHMPDGYHLALLEA
jgi:hypothetical protein